MGPVSARNSKNGLIYADDHHSVAISGNVVLSYSTQPPNPGYLVAWDHATARLAERSAGGLAVITIIDGRTPLPDEASRKSIRDTITKHKDQISALAYVVEGQGFGTAALRSVLSLISLAARYPFPQKVFSTAEGAAAWVSRASGPHATVASLMATVELMRGQVRVAAAG